jgi:hypothetical protein
LAIKAINEGAVARFFTKPCIDAELGAAIRQALREKELLGHARRLLGRARSQTALLERLEADNPGITRLRRNHDGTIVLKDVPEDYDALMVEFRRELDRVE